MANDLRGEVEFEALDKTWTLKMGNGAIRSIENETGKSISVVLGQLNDPETATISMMTTMFMAALRKHHPDVDVEQCDDIIDEIGQERFGELLGKALDVAQPKPKGGGVRPRKATAA